MKVAIIGAGIVGATAAYYLSKADQVELTVFDWGQGQATKAAAGIISPWFSKRRHKAWYRMASLGAAFYQELLHDLATDGQVNDFYQQTGVLLLKKDPKALEDLYQLALDRRQACPDIGDLEILELNEEWPYRGFSQALYASGGARVNGQALSHRLLEAAGQKTIEKKVSLSIDGDRSYQIDGQHFDTVVLASGAWTGQLLKPLGYEVDVRPQKGQLLDLELHLESEQLPVLMPEGEGDLIPFAGGRVTIGASHENDQGFDLTEDPQVLQALQEAAQPYLPCLVDAEDKKARVGTRAYTSDYCPFFGPVPEHPGLFVASGLGSSGLTTGPLIGKCLAQLVLSKPIDLDPTDYPVGKYIKSLGG